MSRIILTGSSGYIGAHLCRTFRHEKVFAIYNKNISTGDNIEPVNLNLLNSQDLRLFFKDTKPDYIIHLAGITPSVAINTDEKFVYQMNVEVTAQIASLSKEFNSYLIFTSTDLVYDEGDDIKEDSPLKPLNLYARTKLEAEKKIAQFGKYFLILRTALMYGFSISQHKSFFDYAFIEIWKGNVIKAFYDQFRNPLFVEEAANFIQKLTDINLPSNYIMNFCGFEKLSRYEIVLKTAEIFNLNTELIHKVSCESFKEYQMAKNLGLNFERMKYFNLIPASFAINLKKLKDNFENYKPYIFHD